jgi:hypothetical protein
MDGWMDTCTLQKPGSGLDDTDTYRLHGYVDTQYDNKKQITTASFGVPEFQILRLHVMEAEDHCVCSLLFVFYNFSQLPGTFAQKSTHKAIVNVYKLEEKISFESLYPMSRISKLSKVCTYKYNTGRRRE